MQTNDAALQQIPGYLAALHGATVAGSPFPNPTSQAQRVENARAVARGAGVEASGVIDPKTGHTTDPNASHWYDPGTIGPLAVAASGFGVGALGGAFAPVAAATGLSTVGSAPLAAATSPYLAALGVAPTAGANAAGTLGASYAGNVAVGGGGGLWGGLQSIGRGLFGGGGGAGGGNLWGPLAASSGLDLLGGYLSSRAANNAANQQLEYGNRALDFEKQRYADAQGNLAPWIDTGQQAVKTAGAAMMPSNGPAPTAANVAPQFMAPFQQNAQNNGSNLVMLQAPDGSQRQVPGTLVPHFLSRGAKVVS